MNSSGTLGDGLGDGLGRALCCASPGAATGFPPVGVRATGGEQNLAPVTGGRLSCDELNLAGSILGVASSHTHGTRRARDARLGLNENVTRGSARSTGARHDGDRATHARVRVTCRNGNASSC